MQATLLTIGDELLIGQVVNTNASWLGEQLTGQGIEVARALTLGDDADAIADAIRRAWEEHALVVVTGGLGPTHDDVTREAVAAAFGVSLREDPAIRRRIEERFARRGLEMPSENVRQALVPEGFEVLTNGLGTAPGLWFARGDTAIVVLPGVPRELETLWREHVVSRLKSRSERHARAQRTLRTAGIGESNLQAELGDLSGWLGTGTRLAYLPGTGGVRLRMSVTADDPLAARERLDAFEAELRRRVSSHIFGTDDDTIESVLGQILRTRMQTLAVAESCTGGLVASRLTDVPGSSAYFLGGVVAYCNSAKTNLLGVDPGTLEAEGAVSEAVAIQMAEGVRAALGADIGLSTTGVAGPSGGTPEKPVGMVWVAGADGAQTFTQCYRFTDDRLLNKALTVTYLLDLVRRRLLDAEEHAA